MLTDRKAHDMISDRYADPQRIYLSDSLILGSSSRGPILVDGKAIEGLDARSFAISHITSGSLIAMISISLSEKIVTIEAD